MPQPKLDTPGYPSRGDKLFGQGRIDPYESRKKLPDPTRCPQCRALYLKGRWTWEIPGEPVYEGLCPACRRINDRVAAGIINIRGDFYEAHRDEVIHLVENLERLEKERRPMERLMGITNTESNLRVETTGVHLAQRIGRALESAYQGDLELDFLKGQYKVRVNWQRS